MLRRVLVQQSQRVRQLLAVQRLQHAAGEPPGEVAVPLPATVQHQHGAVPGERRGQAGGRRMGDVVRHELDARAVQARQGRSQEVRRPLGVRLAQVVPGIVQAEPFRWQAEGWSKE